MLNDITNKSWYAKYEPNNIDEYMFENDNHREIVESFFQQGTIDGNLILFGKHGTGKTSLLKILGNAFIKYSANVLFLDGTVKNIRDDIVPILNIKPVGDKKRLLVMNEFQNSSRWRESMLLLKDKTMEKFQDKNIFIATSNNISGIPDPIIDRFNYKMQFTGLQSLENLLKKSIYILNSEKIKFDTDELSGYLKKIRRQKSLRSIITDLQLFSQSGTFEIKHISSNQTGSEEELINLTVSMLKKVVNSNDLEEKKLLLQFTKNSFIEREYTRILEILDYNLDYDYIYDTLRRRLDFFNPLYERCIKYGNEHHTKKYPFTSYTSFLGDCFEAIILASDVDLLRKTFERI